MLNFLDEFFIIITALIVGSVSNMLIYRLPRTLPIGMSRSKCTTCNHTLGWKSLIPLLSYLFQKGKCAYCTHKISLRYFLVESISVIVFLLLYKTTPPQEWAVTVSVFICLHCLFWIDIETQFLPNILTYIVIMIGIIHGIYTETLPNSILGLISGSSTLYMIGKIGKWIYKKDTIGFGDIKLMAGLGSIVGVVAILKTLYLSFFIGGIIGIFLIILKRKSRKEYIPFGPFIISAFYIVIYMDPFPYVF